MGKASTLTTRKKKMIQQRPIHKLLSLSSSFLKYSRQSIVKSSGHHCTLKWTLSSASITMLPIINSSLESHYLKIYFDKLLCYIYVYNIYIFCLIHIYIMYTTFIMLIALDITIITFLAFLKLLNKKKTSKQNKYAVWVKHSQNYFLLSKRLWYKFIRLHWMHTSCMTLTNILGIKTGKRKMKAMLI